MFEVARGSRVGAEPSGRMMAGLDVSSRMRHHPKCSISRSLLGPRLPRPPRHKGDSLNILPDPEPVRPRADFLPPPHPCPDPRASRAIPLPGRDEYVSARGALFDLPCPPAPGN